MPEDPVLWHLDFFWKQKMDVVMSEHFPGKSDTSFTMKTNITKSLVKKDESVKVGGSIHVDCDQAPDITITYVPLDKSTVTDFASTDHRINQPFSSEYPASIVLAFFQRLQLFPHTGDQSCRPVESRPDRVRNPWRKP